LKNRIIIFGPPILDSEKLAGSSKGGYTRKMYLYLNKFKSEEFKIIPCFHTIRGQKKHFLFVFRPFVDVITYLKSVYTHKPQAVHILAQYRTAIIREWLIIRLSRFLGIAVVYEIKAGVFIEWYQDSNVFFKKMARYCILNSDAILGQGIPYVEFIKTTFNRDVLYFPNFVSTDELPAKINAKFGSNCLKILFVGYTIKEKGVYELIEASILSAELVPVELTIIGKETNEFKKWFDSKELPQNLKITISGVKSHEEVLEAYSQNDIFCYPSYYSGEGHSNSINEAMMFGLIIITSRAGFLGTVLDNESCFFLDRVSPEEIASKIIKIHKNKDKALIKSANAHKRLVDNFTSEIAFGKLVNVYRQIT
jgi:glycosyltransferase involved in cell wall biosynthesis